MKAKDFYGMSPLQYAAQNCNSEYVKPLLALNIIEVTEKEITDDTPLSLTQYLHNSPKQQMSPTSHSWCEIREYIYFNTPHIILYSSDFYDSNHFIYSYSSVTLYHQE